MDLIEKTNTSNRTRLIKAVIGDSDNNMGEVICDSLSEDPDSGITIETAVALRSDDLIELVKAEEFDFALLVLNNMMFDPNETDILKRVESGIGLVSELKHEYGLPVIALYGNPRDSSLAKQITEKGAQFASLIPCDWENIKNAVCRCISMVPCDSE